MMLEGLSKFNESNDLVGSRIRDLPACGIAPQPTTLPHAPMNFFYHMKNCRPP
jgi:hypothetical protein